MLTHAVEGCLAGRYTAMVTGPVQKSLINDAGHVFTGHTEFIAERCGIEQPVMMLAPDAMRGRISGLNQINIGGTMALVNLGNGFIADLVGSTAVLTSLGIGFMVVMLLSLMVATLRNVYSRGVPISDAAA